MLHTWSLAIEEQFYLVWPLVILGVLPSGHAGSRVAAREPRRPDVLSVRAAAALISTLSARRAALDPYPWRRRLHLAFALSAFGTMASALVMAWQAPERLQHHPRLLRHRRRAQALLLGATIALGLAVWKDTADRGAWFRNL